MTGGFRPLAVGAFEAGFAPLQHRLLHGPVRVNPITPIATGLPVLLVANHASWWDGFILRGVQKRLRPGARLYTLMTERQLRRHPYLRWMGCVGVEPGNGASVLAAFRRLRDERRRDENAVFSFFPQGRIWPSSRRPLGFERGVSVLAALLAPVLVIPVAIHLEPLNRIAPTAFVALGPPSHHLDGPADHGLLEAAVELQLTGIRQFLERYGEEAGSIAGRPAVGP